MEVTSMLGYWYVRGQPEQITYWSVWCIVTTEGPCHASPDTPLFLLSSLMMDHKGEDGSLMSFSPQDEGQKLFVCHANCEVSSGPCKHLHVLCSPSNVMPLLIFWILNRSLNRSLFKLKRGAEQIPSLLSSGQDVEWGTRNSVTSRRSERPSVNKLEPHLPPGDPLTTRADNRLATNEGIHTEENFGGLKHPQWVCCSHGLSVKGFGQLVTWQQE